MSEIVMAYNKIKDDYVFPCPNQNEGKEHLNVCQKCPRNKGFIGKPEYTWVRCEPR